VVAVHVALAAPPTDRYGQLVNDSLPSLTTPLCGLLGIRVPVVQAPVGSATTPQLVAAVSAAGGLGMLAITWMQPGVVTRRLERVKDLTAAPVGVNVSLAFPIRAQVDAALAAGVGVVSTFWGDPAELHDVIADAGALHVHTVRSPAEAIRAVESGVDVVVAQGWEAGGHVWGETASLPLIPAVVDAVDPVPVIAAGGISDGRGLAAALVLGAQAAWMGTRFLATVEASTHADYRARLLSADVSATVHTGCFDGGWPDAPHRVLRNRILDEWEHAGRPAAPDRPGEGEVIARGPDGAEFRRYDDMFPLADLHGELDLMALYAGQSVGLVTDVGPASDILDTIVSDAARILQRWSTEPARG
jgi:NAD(P)H-dependent flavin oxidoreductase YrpB (nitropropane dioxygenase family)